MTRLAFRSLASRPLRTVLTLLAILLGVAMITGTYVLTDQIDNGFANIFKTSFKGTAVQVAPKTAFTAMDSTGTTPQTLNTTMLAQIQGVPGVAKAAGTYQTLGAAIVDGKTVQTGGSPTLLTTNPGPPFSQAQLVAGHGAQAANEVSIIKSFADKQGLEAGRQLRRRRSGRPPARQGHRRVHVGRRRLHGRHHRHRRPPAGRAALGR